MIPPINPPAPGDNTSTNTTAPNSSTTSPPFPTPSSSTTNPTTSTLSSSPPTSPQPTSTKNNNNNNNNDPPSSPTAAAVLAYLRKRGLGNAALELTQHLQQDVDDTELKNKVNPSSSSDPSTDDKTGDDKKSLLSTTTSSIEMDELRERDSRTALSLSTGGGMGYDVDSAPSIAMWGNGKINPSAPSNKNDDENNNNDDNDSSKPFWKEKRGGIESKRYIEAYTALQTWVLSLPDDDSRTTPHNKKKRKKSTINPHLPPLPPPTPSTDISHVVTQLLHQIPHIIPPSNPHAPSTLPTPKHELTQICFPLFVHSYCELLECGLEHDAHAFLRAYTPLHNLNYKEELRDLHKCTTTKQIVELNQAILTHSELMNEIRNLQSQLSSLNKAREEMRPPSNSSLAAQILTLKNKLTTARDKSQRLSRNTLSKLPFLKRARSLRWQVRLGGRSYSLLRDRTQQWEVLLPMSWLLQSRCHVIVEGRDPVSFVPGCVFEGEGEGEGEVRWAAPLDPRNRASIMGEEEGGEGRRLELPFPKYEEGDNEEDKMDVEGESKKKKDADNVAFNRALLINGFRRLEALEVKREFEEGMRTAAADVTTPSSSKKQGSMTVSRTTASCCRPHTPSILMATLLSSSTIPSSSGATMVSSSPKEASVNVTCAALSVPDGRRIAVGASDAAIRIHAIDSPPSQPPTLLLGHKNGWPIFSLSWCRDGRTLLSAGGDGTIRLWDTLAVGPRGTTMATVERKTNKKGEEGPVDEVPVPEEGSGIHTHVEGERRRDMSVVEVGGAALCVYRGHGAGTPVWSVNFAPCGYYFLSTGADRTARIWVTDQPLKPVRILAGHLDSVNCGAWHPNCNYVLTGADDGMLRLWDVQNGRCVRVFTGLSGGHHVKVIKFCPSGRYCVGSINDRVGLWDLGSGRLVYQFHNNGGGGDGDGDCIYTMSYSACGTALAMGGLNGTVTVWDVRGCGVNWTVPEFAKDNDWEGNYEFGGRRRNNEGGGNDDDAAATDESKKRRVWRSHQTVLLDLMYTKRNLLMGVGKFVGGVNGS